MHPEPSRAPEPDLEPDLERDLERDLDRVAGPARPGLVPIVVVAAAVGVLAGLTVYARYDANPAYGLLGLDLALGLLSWALSPLLLWRPVPVTLLQTVLAALTPAATPAATIGVLQVAHRRDLRVATAVAAAGVAAHAVQAIWRSSGGISFGWWLLLSVAAYGALVGWGALARARRALLFSLTERARRAEAEQGRRVAEARMFERAQIAREMHDVLAHRLSLLATYAGALEYRPDSPPEQLSRAAGVVRAGVHEALDELREVISLLREDGQDVGAWPPRTLDDIPRLVGESRQAGVAVRFHDHVTDPDTLPPACARTAYRVVQEGLTNARKHAPGRPVRVSLRGAPGDHLAVEISNPVARDGTSPEPVVPGTGTGLIGLTERVQLAGGRLDHAVDSGGEFRLRAWLPWPV